MNEPAGICPGVGIVAGGARLAVGSHDVSSADGGEGCTISAPLGTTLGGATETGLTVPEVPHAARASDATTTRSAPRPRRPMVAQHLRQRHRYSAMRGWKPISTSAATRTAPTARPQISPSRSDAASEVASTKVDWEAVIPSARSLLRSDEIAGRSCALLPEASPTAPARLPAESSCRI